MCISPDIKTEPWETRDGRPYTFPDFPKLGDGQKHSVAPSGRVELANGGNFDYVVGRRSAAFLAGRI